MTRVGMQQSSVFDKRHGNSNNYTGLTRNA